MLIYIFSCNDADAYGKLNILKIYLYIYNIFYIWTNQESDFYHKNAEFRFIKIPVYENPRSKGGLGYSLRYSLGIVITPVCDNYRNTEHFFNRL